MPDKEILLVYDKECPVCNNYCQRLRIREAAGELKLVDAREPGEIMDEITAYGLDIDQGMVLKMGDALYYGADAIHMLSLIGSPSGLFNRLNYWLFRSKAVSKTLYPVLRLFRNVLLKLLGRTKINNLQVDGDDKF
ncbi:DCC1-like thiol-disulfide oxidoreductase family protein [Sulfuriflexus mobilis]|uniref:DCC1-like thiol-disulfide oxidoreductase family protein n=1 Tax=Sulfuriflexus mobilis TaxID=1811807 RepID=UPI000F82679A|nr:DCC1-like thiol-disulfide oxidoreductase family protein [Sulfuriflexus mobilis]